MIRFLKGNVNTYLNNKDTYKNDLFFDTTNHLIYLGGEVFGGNSNGVSLELINNLIGTSFVSIEPLDLGDNGYTFSFKDRNGDSAEITIPLASVERSGVINTTLYNKLVGIDTTKYVEKEIGKGLSTNDFTDVYKRQLDEYVPGEMNTINSITLNGNEVLVEDKIAKLDITDTVKSLVGGVYTYKGSVNTFAELPTTENEIGDVYNVIEASDYPAGTNFAWTINGWDALGGTFDLSPITTKIGNLETTVTTLSNTTSNDISGLKDRVENVEIELGNLKDEEKEGSIYNIALLIVNNALTWEELD